MAVGNFFVAGVNYFIQVPDAAAVQLEKVVAEKPADWSKSPRAVVLPGHDGVNGTEDDMVQRLEGGVRADLEIPGQAVFEQAAAMIEEATLANGGKFPPEEQMAEKLKDFKDPWGGGLKYTILNSARARLLSDGPDRVAGTQWDLGMMIELPQPSRKKEPSWTDKLHPPEPWLERRKRELGIKEVTENASEGPSFTRKAFSGGQTKLEGAAYFRFFMWLMLGTAAAFIPYALVYRPKTQLQD